MSVALDLPRHRRPVESAPWMARGACRGPDVETGMFFVADGDTETIDAAKAVCATCPVARECLRHALRNDEKGVWGGTTRRERYRLTDNHRRDAA